MVKTCVIFRSVNKYGFLLSFIVVVRFGLENDSYTLCNAK